VSAVRALLKVPLTAALAFQPFRRRAIFELRQRYYDELATAIPLGHGLTCPLAFPSAWDSFAEVFVQREYAAAFDAIALPERWIDLGCHAGFFSLFVAWQRAQARLAGPGCALLVDGDSRMPAAVAELIRLNDLRGRFDVVHGVVAGGAGQAPFRERDAMSSSLAEMGGSAGALRDVPILTAEAIVERFAPPYDLVKVDIEGGEYAFADAYGRILRDTRAVLVEWHAWPGGPNPTGSASRGRLRAALADHGFGRVDALVPPAPVTRGAMAGGTTGMDLFLRGGDR
jgi:FkbM family methyltransferase